MTLFLESVTYAVTTRYRTVRLYGTMEPTMNQIHCSRLVLMTRFTLRLQSRCSNDGQLKTHTAGICILSIVFPHFPPLLFLLRNWRFILAGIIRQRSQKVENSCEALSPVAEPFRRRISQCRDIVAVVILSLLSPLTLMPLISNRKALSATWERKRQTT